MSPTGSSTTRSLMNRRILLALKTIKLPKLKVMSKLCPTTIHCCLLLEILLKTLLRLKNQTWTTNKFVLCWLHHGTYRSEKQLRNDRKFITQKKRRIDVQFISRSELHRHRETCFVFTSAEKVELRRVFRESNLLMFEGVMDRFSDSLTRQMCEDLFFMEMEITCLLKQDPN